MTTKTECCYICLPVVSLRGPEKSPCIIVNRHLQLLYQLLSLTQSVLREAHGGVHTPEEGEAEAANKKAGCCARGGWGAVADKCQMLHIPANSTAQQQQQ